MMHWQMSWRADPVAAKIADRHYTRQSIGSVQFVQPGRCLVLRTPDAKALWVTSWPFAQYVKHAWGGAWICSLFRNESPETYLSSDLITQAVAATRFHYGTPPDLGIVTMINCTKVRRKRDFGRCYRRAGWSLRGETAGGLLVLGLAPEEMPPAAAALGAEHRPAQLLLEPFEVRP